MAGRNTGRVSSTRATRGGSGRTQDARRAATATRAPKANAKRKSVRQQAVRQQAREQQRTQRSVERAAKSSAASAQRSRERSLRREQRERSRASSDVQPIEGKRVGDIRAAKRRAQRAERARQQRAKYRKYILRIVAIVAAVLAVVFGAVFVYRSSLFTITNVQVEGADHLTSEQITELAAVPADATLLRVDVGAISERLKQDAWVQDVSIERNFPSGLTIKITEREPGAVVRISKNKIWVVGTDGVWLSAATSDDWDSSPRIVDVSSSLAAPVSGSDCNDDGIKNALTIIGSISDDLRAIVKNISAPSAVKTSLNLTSGITVAFGDASDIELKEADIWALLDKYKGKISYINVRVPEKPSFRSL